ncbi:MAG: AAA domain-containing protein [Bacteroidota bacterium]
MEWQEQKVSEVEGVFGSQRVIAKRLLDGRIGQVQLIDVLHKIKPGTLIVEATFEAHTEHFRRAIGIGELKDAREESVSVGDARPDLIQVLGPVQNRAAWERPPDTTGTDWLGHAVLPDGQMRRIEAHDERMRLRVIDIKQAAEPGAHYFAEVVYYSMALAAWLEEHGLADRFVVTAAPAVWPGTYEDSAVVKAKKEAEQHARSLTPVEMDAALAEDLQIAPVDALAARLARFFLEELPQVLSTPLDDLPGHVNYRCQGCEYLGYPWPPGKDGKPTNEALHCWPQAEHKGHPSRVVGLSRGGARLLSGAARTVGELAALPASHGAFDASQTLRAKRTLYPNRAKSLETSEAFVVPNSGGDALMPSYADLRLYLFLDYDLASAITATFSLRGFWSEPLPYGSDEERQQRRYDRFNGFQETYVVAERTPEAERKQLLAFLRALKGVLDDVREADEADVATGRRKLDYGNDKHQTSTYQLYLWDEAQRKQLARVVSRHLPAILADPKLRGTAWLFTPPELLQHPEEASHKSPFTLVSNVVQNTVAAPVPHHYTLLEVVKSFKPDAYVGPGEEAEEGAWRVPAVHPLFRDPLSDLIPPERLHEMWERRGNWTQTLRVIEETTQKKMTALRLVVAHLETLLKRQLQTRAPLLGKTPSRMKNAPAEAVVLHEFTRLGGALDELEAQAVRAMPPHERVTRFKSALLTERLEGPDRGEALEQLRAATGEALPASDGLWVYRLSDTSRQFNVRPPALGYALAPRAHPDLLNKSAFPLLDEYGITIDGNPRGSVSEAGLTSVSVKAIDREAGLIALKPWHTNCVPDLEACGAYDFAGDVMLDPTSKDYLERKVQETLAGLGRPASARLDPQAALALGVEPDSAPTNPDPETPLSEYLWNAQALSEQAVPRDLDTARDALEAAGYALNESQWAAWEAALTRGLTLVWGPPGTGKSRTLRGIVAAAAAEAQASGRGLRVLIAAHSYRAMDNVLLGLDELLPQVLPEKPYELYRVQSGYNLLSDKKQKKHPGVVAVTPGSLYERGTPDVLALKDRLDSDEGIVIVGTTPHQLHNLAMSTSFKSYPSGGTRKRLPHSRWFDLVVIDEASQLDVAASTLLVSKRRDDGAIVLAGDDLQLAPIHKADAPAGLEHLVGSVYGFARHRHGVAPQALQVNYRSNETLVAFTRRAGYDAGLHAFHPDLRLALLPRGRADVHVALDLRNDSLEVTGYVGRLPDERPADWPDALHWTPGWSALLDPAQPAACFVYEDEVSSQVNAFEAQAVASMLWLLYRHASAQLSGELTPGGSALAPYTPESFWTRGVGVVTPHKAQMGLVVQELMRAFPEHDPKLIWSAVDTVERFQGQERDVIVASFGLGDPDLIEAEDEFLYSLTRFNVMASRARAKLIVLTTRTLVDHLSNDADVLNESRLLKGFAEGFCRDPRPLMLGYLDGSTLVERPGTLRTRGAA